jgi:hypothetical protein
MQGAIKEKPRKRLVRLLSPPYFEIRPVSGRTDPVPPGPARRLRIHGGVHMISSVRCQSARADGRSRGSGARIAGKNMLLIAVTDEQIKTF